MSGGGAALPAVLPGLVGAGIGLAATAFGISYGVWDGSSPGAGFFPVIVGGALVVLSAWIAVRPGTEPEDAPEAGSPRSWRLLGYLVSLLGLALLMEPLGAIATIVLLFLWTLAIVERFSWRLVVPVTAAAAIGGWLLFERLLKVPLPRGLIG